MAASMAPWTFSGDPSVATWSMVQARVAAASARIGPWTAQASTPQLTKVIFFPLGIGLLQRAVTVIAVGSTAALATVALAASRPALLTGPVDASLLESQAEAASSRARTETAVPIQLDRLAIRGRCADM